MPGGSAQFRASGSALGDPVTLTSGAGNISAALSQHGTNTITVEYSGDAFFNENTNALSPPQIVNQPPVAAAETIQRFLGQSVKVEAVTLSANDTDPDGDVLTTTSVHTNSAAGGSVVLQDGWIFYTPPAGLTNSDSFVYQVSDAFGGTAQGNVAVAIVTNSARTGNLTIADLGNGSFCVAFDGVPGATYEIQYASQLQSPDWQTLSTRTADSLGRYEYVDTPPGGTPRIYRSIAQ